jgi:hypothetical protein
MTDNSKAIELISKCDDPKKLRIWIKNAHDKGAGDVADAAFRQLIGIVPSEKPGTVEHDFWRTVHAFEFALTEERDRTTRLNRTRQKIGRVGVVQTLTDWALDKKKTKGFEMPLERGMPELTGEAIILRHSDKFDATIQNAARERLSNEGVDVDRLPTAPGR